MADQELPRNMSLIPYGNESREVVLYVAPWKRIPQCMNTDQTGSRRGNAIVVYDTQSQELSVRDAPDATVDITNCPYCHRPLHEPDYVPRASNEDYHGGTFNSERPVVDPEYFAMLAASQRNSPSSSSPGTPVRRHVQPALRSGRSRDVSGAGGPPPSGAEFVGSTPSTSGKGISSTAFSPGYFAQHFCEEGELGRGGNGVVLLVEHFLDGVSLGHFACKRIPVGNDHEWLKKVLVEVTLLQKLRNKNLVQYYFVWLEDHQPSRFGPPVACLWILQEYCSGGDLHTYVTGPKETTSTTEKLKNRLRRKSKGSPEPARDLHGPSKLTFEEIFSFFRDITSGLHELHTKGYIHRDLKPSNCLLQQDGGKTKVLISDFGEVQAAGAKRGSTGATGTISYCAPEVLARDAADGTFGAFTTKSDIFSLGMIVYFMCFGRLPYASAVEDEENEDLEELRAEISAWHGFNEEARARHDLPEKLYKYLKRLLSVDPSERPSTDEILASIKGGAALGAEGEGSTNRISDMDSPLRRPSAQGRKHSSGVTNRPIGLGTLGRTASSDTTRTVITRSTSPGKRRDSSQATSRSRPQSPLESCVVLRPRTAKELPPSEQAASPLSPTQEGPRLMLPPPPVQAEETVYSLPLVARIALLVLKLVSLSLPCMPYAANPWVAYPLLIPTLLDIGIDEWAPRGVQIGGARYSMLLLAVHIAVLAAAIRGDKLCYGGVRWAKQ